MPHARHPAWRRLHDMERIVMKKQLFAIALVLLVIPGAVFANDTTHTTSLWDTVCTWFNEVVAEINDVIPTSDDTDTAPAIYGSVDPNG